MHLTVATSQAIIIEDEGSCWLKINTSSALSPELSLVSEQEKVMAYLTWQWYIDCRVILPVSFIRLLYWGVINWISGGLTSHYNIIWRIKININILDVSKTEIIRRNFFFTFFVFIKSNKRDFTLCSLFPVQREVIFHCYIYFLAQFEEKQIVYFWKLNIKGFVGANSS